MDHILTTAGALIVFVVLFVVFVRNGDVKTDGIQSFFIFFVIEEDVCVVAIIIIVQIRHIDIGSLFRICVFKGDDIGIIFARTGYGCCEIFFRLIDLRNFGDHWFGQFEDGPAFGTNNRITVQVVIFSAAICTDAFGSKFWSCHSFASSPSKVFVS